MKLLLRSILLIAIMGVSCTTTTNNYITDLFTPTITRFSPDTVWTGKTLTIYGTNFDYGGDIRVTIDTTLDYDITYIDDTMMALTVIEGARTGFIHVWSHEQTATSAKSVVVDYTFNPHSISDTLPDGASFSIPGTGMNNAGNSLRLVVGAIQFHIDSVFPDRIVSHVPPNTPSGNVNISDSGYDNGYPANIGNLTVTRPSAWTTLSQIYNYMTVTESHYRYRYTNGQNAQTDSTWTTKVSYAGQHDTNIAGIKFVRTTQGLQCNVGLNQNNNVPLLQIVWDTVSQAAQVTFQKYSNIPSTPTHSLDTQWSAGQQTLQAPLPVDGNIEFVLPNFRYQINEDSTDTQGLMIWQKVTTTQVTSGEFDIILKH